MTDLSTAYAEIAQRHLDAARVVLDAGLQDVAIFHCYHAFESIACAAISLQEKPPEVHRRKIERFTTLYKRQPFWLGASTLATTISQLRNQALYPARISNVAPSSIFSVQEARALLRRVEGVVRTVSTQLGLR